MSSGLNSLWTRNLTEREVLGFFLAASLLYVYPIIHADFLFIDDQWRSLLMARDQWRLEGRLFTQLFYNVLTLSGFTPNAFPLPLLLALCAMALAMRKLAFFVYHSVDLGKCLVIVPMLYQPFFLSNLSWQYDGPAMVLALAAVLFAVAAKFKHPASGLCLPGLLIALGLGLYQPVLTLFIGLCCLEMLLSVRSALPWRAIIGQAVKRALQLLLGGAFYYCSAFAVSATHRGRLLAFDGQWFYSIWARLLLAVEQVGGLKSGTMGWWVLVVAALAVAGACVWVKRCRDNGASLGIVLWVLAGLVGVIVLCVPGIVLFFANEKPSARIFIGFGTFLLLLFYFTREALTTLHARAPLLLAAPCFYMLLLSFVYGQVLSSKKVFEANLSSHISYDLTSRRELLGINHFYFTTTDTEGDATWVPAYESTFALYPVLEWILSRENTLLIADRFQRLGVYNVSWVIPSAGRTLLGDSAELLIDNRHYQIYRVGEQGLILIKSHQQIAAH